MKWISVTYEWKCEADLLVKEGATLAEIRALILEAEGDGEHFIEGPNNLVVHEVSDE